MVVQHRFMATLFLVLAMGAAALSAYTVFAVWLDEKTSTGTVSLATADIDLYICEPDSTPGPACGSDDSEADEIIFEGTESLTPGDEATYDIRMQNVGATLPWDIGGFDITFTETNDPDADCNDVPTATPRILGKDGDDVNDNHPKEFGAPWVAMMDVEDFIPDTRYLVHVEAGDFEDLRLHVLIPDLGAECSDNEWSINIAWTVYNEGSAPRAGGS